MGTKNQQAVYDRVNIADNLVYEWVRFFKGQVYEWGRFWNTGSYTRTQIIPKLPPFPPPPPPTPSPTRSHTQPSLREYGKPQGTE